MLLKFAAFCTGFAVNEIISLDDDRKVLLKHIENDRLGIHVTDLDFYLTLIPGERQIDFKMKALPAELVLKGTLSHLIGFTIQQNPQLYFSSKKLDYTGDLHVLMRYQKFFSALNINWYRLIPYLPEPVGYMIVGQIKKLAHQGEVLREKFYRDFSEYLIEEKRLIIGQEELEDFFDDIKVLQEQVERMERLMDHLQTKLRCSLANMKI